MLILWWHLLLVLLFVLFGASYNGLSDYSNLLRSTYSVSFYFPFIYILIKITALYTLSRSSQWTLYSISDVSFFAVVSLDSPKTGALSKGVVYIHVTIRRHLILNFVSTDNWFTFDDYILFSIWWLIFSLHFDLIFCLLFVWLKGYRGCAPIGWANAKPPHEQTCEWKKHMSERMGANMFLMFALFIVLLFIYL